MLRRMVHEQTLKSLGMEGLTVVSRLWSLSGLRIDRPAWKAEAVFESARTSSTARWRLRADEAAEARSPGDDRARPGPGRIALLRKGRREGGPARADRRNPAAHPRGGGRVRDLVLGHPPARRRRRIQGREPP